MFKFKALRLIVTMISVFVSFDVWALSSFELYQGQDFVGGLGGFYLKLDAPDKLDSVDIEVRNLLTKKVYLFRQPNREDFSRYPSTIYRAESGKYQVESIKYVNALGKRVSLPLSKRKYRFVVKAGDISYLRLWRLREVKAKLSFEIINRKHRLKLESGRALPPAKFLIDGFNTLKLQRVSSHTKADDPNSNELTHAYSYTRSMKISYRLDLKNGGDFATDVMDGIRGYDSELKQCYADALDRKFKLKGSTSLIVLFSNETLGIRKIKVRSDKIKDEILMDCVLNTLKSGSYAIKRSVIGVLDITFDVQYK